MSKQSKKSKYHSSTLPKQPVSNTPICKRTRSLKPLKPLKNELRTNTMAENATPIKKNKSKRKFLEKESNLMPPLKITKNSKTTQKSINTKSKLEEDQRKISKKISSSNAYSKLNHEKYPAENVSVHLKKLDYDKTASTDRNRRAVIKSNAKSDSNDSPIKKYSKYTTNNVDKFDIKQKPTVSKTKFKNYVADDIDSPVKIKQKPALSKTKFKNNIADDIDSPVKKKQKPTLSKTKFKNNIADENDTPVKIKQKPTLSKIKFKNYKADDIDSPVKINPKNVFKKVPAKFNVIDGEDDAEILFKVKPYETITKYKSLGQVPSFNDILEDRDRQKTFKKKLDHISKVIKKHKADDIEIKDLNSPKKLPHLDCEHLTISEINEYFDKYKKHCDDIIEGRIFNGRHAKFFNENLQTLSMDSLTYNSSMITFSHEQKQRLAKLCERHFVAFKIHNKSKYIFQVLLPELCLKIFMDVQQLDYEKATYYLNNRPLDVSTV